LEKEFAAGSRTGYQGFVFYKKRIGIGAVLEDFFQDTAIHGRRRGNTQDAADGGRDVDITRRRLGTVTLFERGSNGDEDIVDVIRAEGAVARFSRIGGSAGKTEFVYI